MKKLTITLLALAVLLTLAVPAMAAEPINVAHNTTGVFEGIPTDAEDVKYLSDMEPAGLIGIVEEEGKDPIYKDVPFASSGGVYVFTAPSAESGHRWVVKDQVYGTLDKGNREIVDGETTFTFYFNSIHLGGLGKKFDKGVSVHVTRNAEAPVEVVYNVAGYDRFYAVAGGTGDSATNLAGDYKLDFEVWASTATTYSDSMEFVKLAGAVDCHAWYVAEFDLDIEGYNFVKIVTKTSAEANKNAGTYYASWGNAAVYNEKDTTPSTEATTGATEGTTGSTNATTGGSSTEDDNAKTADNFAGIVVAMALLSAGAVVALTSKRKSF